MVYDIDLEGKEKRKLKQIESDKELSAYNRKIILRYIKEAKLGKTILKGQKKKISAGRNVQTISYLTLMCKQWFKKNLNKVTNKDMEDFILGLEEGTIKSQRGTPYSSETQSNIKKFIRKFYKWLIGDGYTFPPLVNWIDTSKEIARIDAVPDLKKGVEKIIELIPDIRRKALIYVLFDSGFRVGEILSVKLGDVERRTDGIYYITCTESKTKKRTVSLNYSSDLLARWLLERPTNSKPEDNLFLTSRASIAKTCKLYGRKALDIHLHPHMLRHTSATVYAPLLSRTHFCKRYGWSYNSQSPDRYIDFAKIEEEKIVEVIKTDSVNDLRLDFKAQLEKERLEKQKLVHKIEELENSMDKRFIELLEKEFKKKYGDSAN